MKKELIINLYHDIDTTSFDIGRALLSSFINESNLLTPQTLYQYQDKVSEFKSIDKCESYWGNIGNISGPDINEDFHIGLCWRRKNALNYKVEFTHSYKNKNNKLIYGDFTLYCKFHKKINFDHLFLKLCSILKPSKGTMHIYTERELENIENNSKSLDFTLGIPTNFEETELTGIHHSSVFSSKFIEQFGFSKLDDKFIEKGEDYSIVKVTPCISDVLNDYDSFDASREELRKTLDQ